MFERFERAGFVDVRSAVVPGFAFRKESTQRTGEQYGVKAVLFTGRKPG